MTVQGTGGSGLLGRRASSGHWSSGHWREAHGRGGLEGIWCGMKMTGGPLFYKTVGQLKGPG